MEVLRMQPIDLITYIVWYATQQGVKLTMNRLVKFLYLADLYHARLKAGKTLTGFPWRFIHYGPYCREAIAAIEKAAEEGVICKDTFDSFFGDEKEFHLFWCREGDAEELGDKIHFGVIGQLQNAIKKYGEDTPHLLDYVYFNTEPMQEVIKGDMLDFSRCRKPDPIEKIELKKLSPETIKLAREKIKKLSDGLTSARQLMIKKEHEAEKYKDQAYYQFLELLDGEELIAGLKGTAKIQMTE